jgi:uncharacterized protein YlxW (UPF0749 family)
MDTTNAERQRRFRERRQQDHQAMQAELAALRARVAQLEAALATSPQRQHPVDTALKQERDALAERLAAIEVYQPGITEKAAQWVAEVDRPRRQRR